MSLELSCHALTLQVKDIVTASPHFDVAAFIPKLRDYLRVVNPNKRQVRHLCC